MEMLRKRTVSTEFLANRPQLCRNCVFPQYFHTRKLSEVSLEQNVIFSLHYTKIHTSLLKVFEEADILKKNSL